MNQSHVVTADERRITLISVLIVFLLSAMNQTVVATAMPRIIADLKGLELYAWVTTAYLLTSTVMVPIWGKLGDLYGRKAVLLAATGIFLVASWLAGLSGEFGDLPLLGGGMTQLIAFRGLQGVGGGGLFTIAFTIIADLYTPRERAQFSGVFGAVFGVASVFGPLVGGFLTDHATTHVFGHLVAGWRFVFYVNLPFSLLAIFMILTKMPGLKPPAGTGHKIDFLGSALLIAAFVPLLLALSLGGHAYAWGSPMVIGLFAAGLAGLLGFVLVERAVRDPILPMTLFGNKVFVRANAAALVTGAAFMGVTSFMPLFMQVGQGLPATQSGLTMLALMVGLTLSSAINGRLVTRTGVYKPFMFGGGVVLLASVAAMTFLSAETPNMVVAAMLFFVGVGLGPCQSLFSLAVQNAVEPHQMGVATSSGQFFRQIGSTLGVAVFGAILTSNVAMEVAKRQPGDAVQAQSLDLADLQRMALARADRLRTHAPPPPPAQEAAEHRIAEAFADAVVDGFRVSLIVVGLALLLILLIPAHPLSDKPHPSLRPAEPEPEKA